MILRRLSTALGEQDWLTVVIETLIVVFGVFIGLQVNNWNETRVHRAAERDLLVQLRNELNQSIEVIEYQSRYVNEVVASGRRALSYLRSGEPE